MHSRLLLLLFVVLTLVGPARADYACTDIFSLTPVLERVENNDFNVRRTSDNYEDMLLAEKLPTFYQLITSLKPESIVMDFGTGLARPYVEIIKGTAGFRAPNVKLFLPVAYSKPTPQQLAKTISKPGSLQSTLLALGELNQLLLERPDLIKYIESGDIHTALKNPNSQLSQYKGQVHLLIDVMGYMMYVRDIQTGLNDIADMLAVGGKAVFYFGEDHLTLYYGDKKILFRDLVDHISAMTGGRLVGSVHHRINPDGNLIMESDVYILEKIRNDISQPVQTILVTDYDLVGADLAPPKREGRVLLPPDVLPLVRY